MCVYIYIYIYLAAIHFMLNDIDSRSILSISQRMNIITCKDYYINNFVTSRNTIEFFSKKKKKKKKNTIIQHYK